MKSSLNNKKFEAKLKKDADISDSKVSVTRPAFSMQMSVEDFRKHYWYTVDLREICLAYGIQNTGTKAELNNRIERVLLGGRKQDTKLGEIPKMKMSNEDLGLIAELDSNDYAKLEGKAIADFSFSVPWRTFFRKILGEPNFKFTKEMAATLREVKKRKDKNFTVRDLLTVYKVGKEQKKNGETLPQFMLAEEETYQWNNFVKAFNSDVRSNIFLSKMKVAAILWSKVRDNPGPKNYRPELIDDYFEEIKSFIKKDTK